jgi:anaerobic ribonucleoside-triphosphate reductase activating protein
MRYSGLQIVFQEIPDEISLALHVTGCPLRCKGCHSNDLWNADQGIELDPRYFNQLISQYSKYMSCVLFMGGEWELSTLISLIDIAKQRQKKTALYTGLELSEVPEILKSKLDYLKYGPYISTLGGLNSKTTNQRLLNLKTNEILNSFFTEDTNDQTHR